MKIKEVGWLFISGGSPFVKLMNYKKQNSSNKQSKIVGSHTRKSGIREN